MKTRNDDFSNSVHPEENNIAGTFAYKALDGKYYKMELDFSPASFIRVIKANAVRKPLPWGEYVKFTTEEEQKANYGRKGKYVPAKNVDAIIASLVEEPIKA